MKKLLLLGALALGIISPAAAQTPSAPSTLTGTEKLKATCNNGSYCDLLVNHVRNTLGYLEVTAGTSVTSNPTWYNTLVIALGAITTWSVNLPNPAPDGMVLTIANSTAAALTSNTTVQAKAGSQTQTLAVAYTSQTLAANGGRASWQFNCTVVATCTAGTWYRVE